MDGPAHGNGALQPQGRGGDPFGDGPPPSTLAAQLVENISSSTKSSRSDENVELKGFFAVIQRVKDDPDLLKSPTDRIEHNHMLIYVYCRVVLEGIKLDDPFLDRSRMRAEFLKAINFLRFTIKETPLALVYRAKSDGFLFRGEEPLWMWLLPQLLRLLGHSKCLDLEGSIEGFLQYTLLTVARNDTLWPVAPNLGLYLRAVLTEILDRLHDTSLGRNGDSNTIALELPPKFISDQILDSDRSQTAERMFYSISSTSQALRQASSLANVLMYPFTSSDVAFNYLTTFAENGPWLMDTWLDLNNAHAARGLEKQLNPSHGIGKVLDVMKHTSATQSDASFLGNKALALLVLLCGEMISAPDHLLRDGNEGNETRFQFCLALLEIAKSSKQSSALGRLALSKIVREMTLLSANNAAVGQDTDIWRCTCFLRHSISLSQYEAMDQAVHPSLIKDEMLRRIIQDLEPSLDLSDAGTHLSKRRKIPSQGPLLQVVERSICDALQLDDSGGHIQHDQAFLTAFEKASDSSKCLVIDLLSRLCCVTDQSIEGSTQENLQCSICDTKEYGVSPTVNASKSTTREIFANIISLPIFLESRRLRVAAMLALQRLVLHCEDSDFLDLETSSPGQWCLQSLNSSIRELRIAAGRTLAIFMLPRAGNAGYETLIARNRKNSIALLKSASEKDQAHLIESRIMAWGQLGRVVSDNELNLVLIKLLEYLGNSNNIISAFAFNELLNLAESLNISPRRLFEPFWKSLAYMVTKDMVQRPQRSRAIAELLQISVNDLLLLIQTHALPWLVLDRRKEVIQKIAEARHEDNLWLPLMDSANLAATLGLLLVQETEAVENFAKSRLDDISSHFHPLKLQDLIQSEPVLIAMELLKAAAEADDARKKLIHKALRLVATTLLSANGDSKPKKGNIIGRFLQSHALGLMARLTDVINDSGSVQSPVVEQRICIQALEEMIKISDTYARIARPQISACLLAVISDDALREAAVSCWAAMLLHLEEEDIGALIETSFFIVNRYWNVFTPSTAKTAKSMLEFVLDQHEAVIRNYIAKLPSLSQIKELREIETRLQKLRPPSPADPEVALGEFAKRISHDNSGVVQQALTELTHHLRTEQNTLYTSAISQRPDTVISTIIRAILDCACRYNGVHAEIGRLCVECIGLIGCLDSNQIETVRAQRSIVVLDNFSQSEEVTDFGLFLIEVVLVPSFLSATDTKLQGFLSYAMQELLDTCDIKAACAMQNTGAVGGNEIYRKWQAIPDNVREVATPFLTSRYMVAPMAQVTVEYPIYHPGKSYGNWLRSFVVDLLRKGQTAYADLLFEPLTRVIRVKDLSTAEFLLPYLVLHVLLGSKSPDDVKSQVLGEITIIMEQQLSENASFPEKEELKRFCHAVFRILDYAMRWIHAKRSSGRLSAEDKKSVSGIQKTLDTIPAELIAQRAIDCTEFARALFHLEQHAQTMEPQKSEPGERTRLLGQLQDIYANIDEPDGLEGISAHLHVLDINQQILSHKKAGRWTAAQTWYEMQLAENPDNADVQINLLNCLKQGGQHDVLLNHIEGMRTDSSSDNKIMPFAVEAAWVTGRWDSLAKFTNRFHGGVAQDFNVSMGALFDLLYRNCPTELCSKAVREMRDKIASGMTTSATASLQAAHGLLLQAHALTDLEIIVGARKGTQKEHKMTLELLEGRLEIMGGHFNDKQYLLGIRRAAMQLSRHSFSDTHISSLWLASARLARKSNHLHQSFNAVLHASQLGDDAATIENAKLLWRDGNHRKAIQVLQGAIEQNKFMTQSGLSVSSSSSKMTPHQKLLAARAQLLLAKWLDAAGQTHAGALREKYQQPPKTYSSWEKGHYYLGRHYKKILESEQPLKVDDQSDNYVTGEIARLVIENYVRSLNSGTKFLYQTLPRVLTLWLDLGAQINKAPEGKASLSAALANRRAEQLDILHAFLDKYIKRLPAYVFYTALPQIVARIAHPNSHVFKRLTHIIVKVVQAHPRQALWSLIGAMTTKQVSERKTRGMQILQMLRNAKPEISPVDLRKSDAHPLDLKLLLRTTEKLADQLLLACQNGDFHGNKAVHASLTRDLRFNHKCTPCGLVVPVEACLTATLPALSELVKSHKAFSEDVVTIHCFLDDVLVLSSLAKPRRLKARGSDGKIYMLLIKPKDDLRTDQRLMEFNGMINRSLKRDAESSRRQLYIRTYAVVPLNEECGIIEWVPGIKTMRDILLNLYASQKIFPDYGVLKQLMEEASTSDSKVQIFTEDVLNRFPPLLPLWFIRQFPNPSAWFAARLKYTRSCAVMSMVGTILGLGDRHGENVNLEEGNGGVFHVDFNCLFDKGLTFAKPERVPFRLTHNMVAAMGIYGYEGPFRKSSELTLSILRQQEETLMTILEAFIYDPTLDLQKEKRTSRRGDSGVKLQPQSVVDSIRRKVKGLLPNESIPLSVEGQVEELIKQAVDPRNLTAMYIGWCPFL